MSCLLGLFARKRMESDLDKELRFHLESQVAEKMRRGISESEARRLTRLEFGGIEQIKEGCRESRGTQWFESTVQDVRYSLRQLRKSPGFTLTAVTTTCTGHWRHHRHFHARSRCSGALTASGRSLSPLSRRRSGYLLLHRPF
jgi:hypothetical protein